MKHPPRTIQVGVLVYPGCLRSSAVVPLDVLRIANAMTGYRPAKERLRFECRWLGARGEPTLAGLWCKLWTKVRQPAGAPAEFTQPEQLPRFRTEFAPEFPDLVGRTALCECDA